ncbi:MAG: DegV family protein [Clostridia bacterium]|nr:DegV family protein [Clostridia bacterium]
MQTQNDNKLKVKVITDSNSGLTQKDADKYGIGILPMPFTIDGEEFFEEISISQQEFYEKLKKNVDVKTSQPSRTQLKEAWDEALKDYDQVVFMPMTSGLSGTCNNAKIFAEEEYNGKVIVVDNKRISINLKESVLEAVNLLKQGKSAQEVKDYLENTAEKHSVYITVNVLKYLKRGGRISSAAAALGTMLNFKPILFSRGQNFEKFGIVMSMAHAKKKMIQKVKEEFETQFAEEYKAGKMKVAVAHTQNEQEALKFAEEIKQALPNVKLEFVDPLSLSVACHIGPGALAITSFISCNN